MATPITANMSVQIGTGATVSLVANWNQSTTDTGYIGNEQVIGTSEEALLLGDVGATPACIMIKNLDATNFVQVDAANDFTKFPQKILPGQAVFLAPETGTIYVKADTAPVSIFVAAA